MIRRAKTEDAEALAGLAAQMWTEHDPEELTEEFRRLAGEDEAACFLGYAGEKPAPGRQADPGLIKGENRKMTYCGNDCCKECGRLPACGGCEQCQGHPFGGSCVAERNKDFPLLKRRLIDEINALGVGGLAVADLNLLTGSFVNLAYPLAGGTAARFLKDDDIYLGNQIEQADSDRCYGVVANEDFILVCEYGCGGSDPEIVLYKRRRQPARRPAGNPSAAPIPR